jgi:hypothetical protein
MGPMEAPKATIQTVPITAREARGLAYYSAQGIGVLAPRGWYCFGVYGSSGDGLAVSPEPIDTTQRFSADWKGFAGPAIEISHSFGGTSGRFTVAEIIARVFPDYKAFATHVAAEFPQNPFTVGPYPNDVLTYKSKTMVEYKTPALTEGLGTRSSLKKNGSPIEGVAVLTGEKTPDVLLLSVRLPPELTGLTSVIVGQVEREAR